MVEEAVLSFQDLKSPVYAHEIKKPTLMKPLKNPVARLYLPASWAGKRVLCLLLDDIEDDKIK